MKISSEQSRTTEIVEEQVLDTFTFFDYDKNIHSISDASTLTRLMSKNEVLKGRLKEKYDGNSGFYVI